MQPVSSFTALKRRYVTVNVEDGPSYQLRDDVPMEVMALYLDIMATSARYNARMESMRTAAPQTVEEQAALVDEIKDMLLQMDQATLEICVSIWRHTLPDRSDEDLATEISQHFAFEDRRAIAELFFSLRSARSSNASDTTTTRSPTSGQASTQKPTRSSPKPSRAHR